MLARKLQYSVDDALKRALENEMVESLGLRISQMANGYAKRAGNSVYFAHTELFGSKGEAQQLAVSYFTGNWSAAMQTALKKWSESNSLSFLRHKELRPIGLT